MYTNNKEVTNIAVAKIKKAVIQPKKPLSFLNLTIFINLLERNCAILLNTTNRKIAITKGEADILSSFEFVEEILNLQKK
jgi:hypothetical protein